jgi:PAS domain S-box-containing protein
MAIGVAWPDVVDLDLPGMPTAQAHRLLAKLGVRDKLFLTEALDEVRTCGGATVPGAAWLAAFPIRPHAVALFVVGRGRPDRRALTSALGDTAGAVAAMLSQRKAQARLRVCQAQLEAAEELGQAGHWSYDVVTRRYEVSPMAGALHGLPIDVASIADQAIFANVVADDMPGIERAFVQLRASPGGAFSSEYRVQRDGREPRLVSSVIGGRTDETGALTTITGVCRDVSEERSAQRGLETSEAHFRHLAETSDDILVCYAPSGLVTYASPAAASILGYAMEELVGKSIEFLMVPVERQAAIERFKDCVRGRLPDNGETFSYRVLCKDGRRVWLESRPRAVTDPETGLTLEVRDALRDITVRKQAEAALTEQQRYMQMLTDGSSDLIVRFTLEGIIEYVSPASLAIIGLPPEALIGRKTWDFIHPEDHKLVVKAFRTMLQASPADSPRFQYRLVQPSGAIRHIEANPSPVRDPDTGEITQFFDVARDVTERYIAEAQLKSALERAEAAIRQASRSEARYRLLADTARDITIQYDVHGVIRYASPSSRQLGYTPAELVGRHIEDFVHPEDRPEALRVALANFSLKPTEEPSAAEIRLIGKDGDYVWFEGNPAVVRDGQGHVAIVNTTLRDITERRKLIDRLVEARIQAEAATAAKSAFLANMSHELRTPLTSVIGFSQQILQQQDLPGTVEHAADRIVAGGRTLLTTINDILDFSKVENGDIKLAPRAVAADAVVTEVAELLRLGAEQKGLTLEAWGDPALPEFVLLDPDRLRQVLLNLAGNAIKFTARGSVDLLVRYSADTERLRIEVRDTGVGIAADQAQKLFKRFSQVDDTIPRKYGGTGLGLAISKGLVEAMQGEIGVTSEFGQGSTFWVEIPSPRAAAPAVPAGPDAEGLPLGSRVLLVDDHAENLEVLGAILTSAGACVWKVSSPLVALGLCGAGRFDVIITDRRMPEIGGVEFARRLREARGPNRHAPILLCTADQAPLSPSEATLFDGVLMKPIAPLDLIERVAAIINEDMGPAKLLNICGTVERGCDECSRGLADRVSLTPSGDRCSSFG